MSQRWVILPKRKDPGFKPSPPEAKASPPPTDHSAHPDGYRYEALLRGSQLRRATLTTMLPGGGAEHCVQRRQES